GNDDEEMQARDREPVQPSLNVEGAVQGSGETILLGWAQIRPCPAILATPSCEQSATGNARLDAPGLLYAKNRAVTRPLPRSGAAGRESCVGPGRHRLRPAPYSPRSTFRRLLPWENWIP